MNINNINTQDNLSLHNENLKITPMMQQYLGIKEQYKEYLLFFRLGDFYELFFDDAKKASTELGLLLTSRGNLNNKPIPMCGLPFHSYETYVARLIKAGFKIAICEQTQTPEEALKLGNKLVNREVVRVITPGTLLEDSFLVAQDSNYLACVYIFKNNVAIAYTDISTGEFIIRECKLLDINTILQAILPSELLISTELDEKQIIFPEYKNITTVIANEKFNWLSNSKLIEKTFGPLIVNSLSKYNIISCGVLLDYIQLTQKNLNLLKPPKLYNDDDFLKIDYFTYKSLEISYSYGSNKHATLRNQIDYTKTAMGSRILSSWLLSPLKNVILINNRLDKVEFFVNNNELRTSIINILQSMPDLERIMSKMSFLKCTISDIYLVRNFLRSFNNLKSLLLNNANVDFLTNTIVNNNYSQLLLELEACLLEFLPTDFKDVGFFKNSYDAYYNEAKQNLEDLHNILLQLQQQYSLQLGATVKINYLNNLGYCIELSNKHIDKINKIDEFKYKSATTTTLRYSTLKLQELQDKILFCNEQKQNAEKRIFNTIVDNILQNKNALLNLCTFIANLDAITSLAFLSVEKNLVKPIFTNEEKVFKVTNARHLVVEDALKKTATNFVSNNCHMDNNKHIFLITGPNMGGKSTYLRQNALIIIMAQMGCFVPAQSAKLSVVDAIFSRVGASDDLFKGQSTFMVEMLELSYILNYATANSFIILDEIGRGTSTYDGMSIAWATLEYLNDTLKTRCLFATHYHELLELQDHLDKLDCYYVKTIEEKDNINFMYLVIKGFSTRSYGIKVAKLAGLPTKVISRANQIVVKLEKSHVSNNNLPLFNNNDTNTFNLLETNNTDYNILINTLNNLDINNITPKQALNELDKLIELVKDNKNNNT